MCFLSRIVYNKQDKWGETISLGYMKQIRERIDEAKERMLIIHAGFVDVADAVAIRRTLNRLVERQVLKRVMNGIYEKARYSSLLKEYVATDPHEVAKTLARNYHWPIAPDGSTALNLLGLSPQVTAVWSYRSDGPYRTYPLNHQQIVFKHRTNKEIAGLSDTTALVVQALKALGRESIDAAVIAAIAARLSEKDKETMLEEASESTDWVYEVIRKICGKELKA